MQVRPIRVVLIERNAPMRKVMRWMLEDDGRFDVRDESDGIQDLARRCVEADVVLVDLVLADGDGLEATAEVRRANPSAKVAMVSAYAQPYFRDAARAAGVSAFIDAGQDLAAVPDTLAQLVDIADRP